ncbi:amidase protein (plasmid) [Rhizobium gallicum]|uniref:Amidase protein n=1 Tax=Rhizobium gallicum TaxID=56730 RepID=A0A1L5NR60_9HYPH|nr:amidase [Rhizobium gallicum]APO70385.1 amidase protein [Rhizobium gallicum]
MIEARVTDAHQICELDGATLTEAYSKGLLSPVEVVIATLERAEQIQDQVNAFTFLDPEGALSAARAAEARWRAGAPRSPIDGVPTTLKDIVHVVNWSVRYGSRVSEASPFGDDAPAVAGLRDAGAVFIGQTTTPEFGWKAVTDSALCGITRNPWNPNVTPGGSSGGAAVAAACGAGVLHLGTDGGGSIRIPASFTGTVGHKPSFGRVGACPPNVFGTVAHIGPMTRTVGDAITMLTAMAGRDRRDWTQPPMAFPDLTTSAISWTGKRIGYWKTPIVGAVCPEVARAVEAVLDDLETAGAEIHEVALPGRADLLEVFYRHWYVGAANRLSTIPLAARAALDPGFLNAAEVGERYSAVDRMWAEVRRAQYGAAMDGLLIDFDFLMSPTVPTVPFTAGRDVPDGSGLENWIEWSSFSFPINLSQQPACSVPCGFTPDGLPIGLQIISARGDDAGVLSAALAYEQLYTDRFLTPGGTWPELTGGAR